MPHIQKLYAKFKSKGFTVIAVDRGDSAEVITKYWKESKFTFPAVMGPVELHNKFGVRAYPTNYVVDSKGKVLTRFVGYEEPKLLAALKSQGIE